MNQQSLICLEEFLRSQYEFRNNEVKGRVEARPKSGKAAFKNVNDRLINSLWRSCSKNSIQTSPDEIRRLIESDFVSTYNPFRSYIDGLPAWDGTTDHIQQLTDTIKTTNQSFWAKYLRKWLVATVVCLYKDKAVNQQVLILMGRQGLGKSTWLDRLVPKSLNQYYYSGTIEPNNKDTLIHLSECMLINLDELENMNRKDVGSFKQIITQGSILVRRPYARYPENLVRRASFVGSVNSPRFLNDPTGSRRYLCFEATKIDHNHKVDIDLVYAQAVNLYLDGFISHLSTEEEKEVMKENEQFTVETTEMDYLSKYFEVTDETTATDVLTTTELLHELNKLVGNLIPVNNSSLQKLGKSLSKSGFTRVKRANVYKHLLLRKELPAITSHFTFDNIRDQV
ncbi:VapE domain-containing protein [Spirosoma soli]|uniref:VapE domain-containing protein n=1 Tax=Spirosoma soli TaxID=1770529 RepID=A0ABW5MCE1_9BACT